MGNLLTAGLRRMVKSRAFLLALLAELAYTALVVLVCWDHYAAGTGNYTLESVLTAGFGLMGYLPVPSLIAAPLLSLGVIAASTAAGLLLFRRKDLK